MIKNIIVIFLIKNYDVLNIISNFSDTNYKNSSFLFTPDRDKQKKPNKNEQIIQLYYIRYIFHLKYTTKQIK